MIEMTFKKDGADPVTNEPRPFIGFRWVGVVAQALGLIPQPEQEKARRIHEFHYGRSRGRPTPRKKHRNMLLVQKRIRRKHRRAAIR